MVQHAPREAQEGRVLMFRLRSSGIGLRMSGLALHGWGACTAQSRGMGSEWGAGQVVIWALPTGVYGLSPGCFIPLLLP